MCYVLSFWLYLESANEVVSCQQLVEYEFEWVIPAGLIQSEHVKRPRVHMLRGEEHFQIMTGFYDRLLLK